MPLPPAISGAQPGAADLSNVTVRLSAEQRRALRELATADRRSVSETIRIAIDDLLERRGPQS